MTYLRIAVLLAMCFVALVSGIFDVVAGNWNNVVYEVIFLLIGRFFLWLELAPPVRRWFLRRLRL